MYDPNRMSEIERQQARDTLLLLYEHGSVHTSLMQRSLRIGYGRAVFILDLLRDLGLVELDPESRNRRVPTMERQTAEDKLEAWLADHAEEDHSEDGWDEPPVIEEPVLKEGVDPLLPRLALTVGVNGDRRLVDAEALKRELTVSDTRAQGLIDVMLETGVIRRCSRPVYEATKDGDALRRLYDYMGLEMPAGEDVDCLAALLSGAWEDDESIGG